MHPVIPDARTPVAPSGIGLRARHGPTSGGVIPGEMARAVHGTCRRVLPCSPSRPFPVPAPAGRQPDGCRTGNDGAGQRADALDREGDRVAGFQGRGVLPAPHAPEFGQAAAVAAGAGAEDVAGDDTGGDAVVEGAGVGEREGAGARPGTRRRQRVCVREPGRSRPTTAVVMRARAARPETRGSTAMSSLS